MLKDKGPLEGVVISAYRKANAFKVQMKKKFRTNYCKSFAFRYVIPFSDLVSDLD